MLQATSPRPVRSRFRTAAAVLLGLALTAGSAAAQARSTLAVAHDGRRVTWWRSDAPPGRWGAPDARVLDAVRWRQLRPGLRLGELDLLVNRGLLRLRVIVAEVALADYDVALERSTVGGRGAWSVDDAPPAAALAVNAGQFTEAAPWGWLVLRGRVVQAPGQGPLSAALAADSSGLRWLDPDELDDAWDGGHWQHGFQSYPVLLRRGEVPAPLRPPARQLDLRHRDARLALGLRADTMLLALTRFDAGGEWLGRVPVGLTVPETAALMGALGARDALMLDGGLSAQLLARDRGGRTFAWRGARAVPLGLVLTERTR